MELDSALRSWVNQELGPTTGWVRLGQRTKKEQGGSVVHGLLDAQGRGWIVKRLRSARGFAQEQRALTDWFTNAEELGGARVPHLRGARVELDALLIERLEGAPVDGAGGDLAVQHAAGRFLAALHGIPLVDTDPMPLADAIERRAGAWLARAELEPSLARIVRAHGPHAGLFEGATRVACHRDFAPRNWLWDGRQLAVFDFEHARPDLALVDLCKLHVDVWSRDSALATAFFAGYGRVLSDRERAQLRALLVLHGLASLVWGRERGQPDHVAEGRRALDLAHHWPPDW